MCTFVAWSRRHWRYCSDTECVICNSIRIPRFEVALCLYQCLTTDMAKAQLPMVTAGPGGIFEITNGMAVDHAV